MKTAVSLPNLLFEKADETASYLRISRSKLFALALEEFIEKYNDKIITEKINAVYERIDQSEFDHYLNVGLEPTRNLTKNDTW